jgi:hypothetical protein
MLVIEKQGLFDYTIGFDFDQPRGVNEAGYLKECARRTNVTEHFSMSARRIAPTCDICKHDAGSNDLGHRPACLRDRLFDDFEAMLGLPINVAPRGGSATGGNRRSTSDGYQLPNSHCTAEADFGLEI